MSPVPQRIGIVGARRVRQGLGPFVARGLARHGATIAAVLGTSPATARAAAEEVERASGAQPGALADPDAFDALELDAVCVLSPPGTHAEHVERALARGRHVLCEKPFLWQPETDWVERARSLEDRFAAAGLVLAINAQWPWVLPAFEKIAGRRVTGATRLAMGLSPASSGEQMIGDALPHPISVAQALRPDLESLADVRFDHPDPEVLTVFADLAGADGPFRLEAELGSASSEHPREAWLAIDDVRADRCVRSRDYALFFRRGARLVDLPDPLTARLAAFLADVASADGAPREPDRRASRRAAILAAVVERYRAEFGRDEHLQSRPGR